MLLSTVLKEKFKVQTLIANLNKIQIKRKKMIIIKELQKDVNQKGKGQKTHLISRAYNLKEVTQTHKHININIRGGQISAKPDLSTKTAQSDRPSVRSQAIFGRIWKMILLFFGFSNG
jgi:hypothetical protein